jgi:hypothetical protein
MKKRWFQFERQPLPVMLRGAFVRTTTYLFWFEWPLTVHLLNRIPNAALEGWLTFGWIALGGYLWYFYCMLGDLYPPARRQLIFLSLSGLLNGVIGFTPLVLEIMDDPLMLRDLYKMLMFSAPLMYFGGKMVISFTLAHHAWERLRRDREEVERLGALTAPD